MKQVLIAAYVGKRNEYKYRGMSNILNLLDQDSQVVYCESVVLLVRV